MRVVDQRRAVDGPLGGDAYRAVQPRAELDLARKRGGPALVAERVHRDLPAVAAAAEEVLLRHHDVVEEQLAELGMACDLGHRAQLDAGRAHVDDEHGDALVLRRGVVGAREHAAPPRELAPRHPRLLAGDDVVVVVLDGARAQRREIRAGLRLREPLAPDLLCRQDRRDVAPALLVGAEAQQRRPEHVEADDTHVLGRAGGGELLVDDDLLGGRAAAAPELARPRPADVPGRVAARLPAAQRVHASVQRARQVARVEPLGGKEGPDLLLERALGGRGSESHGAAHYQSDVTSGTLVVEKAGAAWPDRRHAPPIGRRGRRRSTRLTGERN